MIGNLVPTGCLNDRLLPSHPMDLFLWDDYRVPGFLPYKRPLTRCETVLTVRLEKATHLFRSFPFLAFWPLPFTIYLGFASCLERGEMIELENEK